MNKADARTRTLELMDAARSTRWDITAGGFVDRTIGMVQLREWRQLLDMSPYYAVQRVTIASDANGRYARSGLDTGSGDNARRHYRVLGVKIDERPYAPVALSDFPFSEDLGAPFQYVWMEEGDSVLALPKQASKSATFLLNYLPVPQHSLADESSTFTFPAEYEDVVLLEAAAYMLGSKAGAEANPAGAMKGLAEELRRDLYASLGRLTAQGPTWKAFDDPLLWGSTL